MNNVYIFVLVCMITACGNSGAFIKDGVNGTNGTNGHSAASLVVPADTTACTNGGSVFNLGVDLNDNGKLDSNEVQSVSIVCNGLQGATGVSGAAGSAGKNGTNGTNGTNATVPAFTPVFAITPCGANSSTYKEVLLGLAGGSILSEFSGSSDALQTRNTLLQDGSYYDTDSSECNFSVLTSSNGNRTVKWDGTSANGGTYHAGSANYNAVTEQWSVQQ